MLRHVEVCESSGKCRTPATASPLFRPAVKRVVMCGFETERVKVRLLGWGGQRCDFGRGTRSELGLGRMCSG